MRVINVHNVNQALAEGLDLMQYSGVIEESRNGPVLVLPEPVTTIYQNPQMRVLLSPKRNANPFFHVMEALWMLAGRNDLKFINQFNKQIAEYSDDGKTFHGAYGYRWRHQFFIDQLDMIVEMLRAEPSTRRAVLGIWDPPIDLNAKTKDLPCNDVVFFDYHNEQLNCTICCRSNDMWWGAYGANAVHFSFLLEYIAARSEIPMGVMRQVSNNMHIYTAIVDRNKITEYADDAARYDPYTTGPYYGRRHQRRPLIPTPRLVPFVSNRAVFDVELRRFMDEPTLEREYKNVFLEAVAVPMARAWKFHKIHDYKQAQLEVGHIRADDWRLACAQWLVRRQFALMEKKNVARQEARVHRQSGQDPAIPHVADDQAAVDSGT